MKAITAALYEWGTDKLREGEYNPFSSGRIFEVNSTPASSKILGYDPKDSEYLEDGQKLSVKVNRAWLDLPGEKRGQKACVYGKFVGTQIVKEDGNIMTAKEIARALGLSKEKFDEHWGRGVTRISGKVGL